MPAAIGAPRRRVSPDIARARARLAGLTARGADPAVISSARAELGELTAAADIRRWPPLPAETRKRLAAMVLTGGDHAAA